VLQIISGKFFGDGERYEFEQKGILYSNMTWFRTIETCVGTLEVVDAAGSEVSSYVLSYLNQIEKEPAGGIVRTGDPEIVEQFGWLCMIWFEAFLDGDRQNVVINCREKPAHAGDQYVGSSFAKPYLSPQRWITVEEEQGFVRFVDNVIGLPRRDYLAIMSFVQTMSHALHVLRQNLDLAYSMLVYALEALSQGRSDYLPRWEDYDSHVKKQLNPILDEMTPEKSEAIRAALLEDAHLKLQQQFLDFTISHIPDSFFIKDANRVERPVRCSELKLALKNAYRARSSYVHELLPLIHQIKTRGIAEGEVFEWDNKPYLTFNGLLRIARTVVLNFVRKQPYLEEEEYNWVSELPGQVTMKWTGQVWIGRPERFSPARSAEWLSAFLSVWLEAVSSEEQIMPDLRPLLAKFESVLGSASATHRAQMLAIHVLYNCLIAPEAQSPEHEAVYEANARFLDECRIESMIRKVLLGREWPWDAEDCARAYETYAETKFHKGGLSLPWSLEVAMMVYVAGKYREDAQDDAFVRWTQQALLESAGQSDWQSHIRAVQAEGQDVNLNVFFARTEVAALQ
jgi:hypothetical protein